MEVDADETLKARGTAHVPHVPTTGERHENVQAPVDQCQLCKIPDEVESCLEQELGNLFPNAIEILGSKHLLDNLLSDVTKAMPNFGQWLNDGTGLRSLSPLVCNCVLLPWCPMRPYM